jgi:hypothetical protein
MKYRDFEQYLQFKFMEDEPQVLDDDIPDAYESLIVEQDIDDVIKWATEYGNEKFIAGLERARELLKEE